MRTPVIYPLKTTSIMELALRSLDRMPDRRPGPTAPSCALGLIVLLALGGCAPPVESAAEEPTHRTGIEAPDPLTDLLEVAPPDSATEEEAIELLREGVLEWRDGDERAGAALVDEALALLPALQDWRPLIRAELLAPAGDTVAVHDALEELARVDPGSDLLSRWGWRFMAEAHEAAGNPGRARQVARVAALEGALPSVLADQWLMAGRMALASGDSIGAREDLWQAVRRGPGYSGAQAAARLLDPITLQLVPAEEAELGLVLHAAGAWEATRARLSVGLQGPGLSSEAAAELRLALGRALLELRRSAEAEDFLSSLTLGGGDESATRSALLMSGQAALQRGAVSAAETHLRTLATIAPGSREAEEGLHLLLNRELQTGFGPRSRALLDDLLLNGVGSAPIETTVVQLGTTLYLNGDYDGAALTFESYQSGSRRTAGRQQAGYWAALSHQRRGETELAEQLLREVHDIDPFSTYGSFAGDRIGVHILDPNLPVGPLPLDGLEDPFRNALTRLRVHRIVPTSGSFAFELERLTGHFLEQGTAAYDFAEAMIEGGFALQAIVLGRDLRQMEGEWNLRLLKIVHPLPHRDALFRESLARGLDPFFVAGLIRQESAFDHQIASVAGAMGLMQLMPATAAEVAASLGITLAPGSLTDPEINIRLGTTYLRNMLTRFDGRAEDALAAYNAGPGRISQWRNDPTYRDTDVFIEHIPFQETRNYVKIVKHYTRIYTALYGCDSGDPCLGLSYSQALARSPVAGSVPTLGTRR
jgi:tetratricopeptide (TPR) repeat protein